MLFDLSTPYAAYSLQNLKEAVKIFEPSVYLACYILHPFQIKFLGFSRHGISQTLSTQWLSKTLLPDAPC